MSQTRHILNYVELPGAEPTKAKSLESVNHSSHHKYFTPFVSASMYSGLECQ